MAEPAHAAQTLPPAELCDAEKAPLDPADFPGCEAIHIAPEDIEEYEGRLEYWEERTATAMVVREPTTTFHERPSQRLARLAERIAASRGSPIETFGTSDLVRFDLRGKPRVLMQADQILYLRPPPAGELTPRVDVDGDQLPDVVLEVDYSTDVRVRKLPLYEAWGFPEVWVDVPDERSPSRPKSRLPGLTVHVREDDRFVEAESSRAFPGWKAEEIHRALNEHAMSDVTLEALHRVGAALGAAEGTGPDDDRWLRHYRAEGRTEGHIEGRAESRLEAVLAILKENGVSPSSTLADRLATFATLPTEATVRAALRSSSERHFLALCAAETRKNRGDDN